MPAATAAAMAATKAGAMRTQRNRDRASEREWRKTAKESAPADHVHRETETVGERERERGHSHRWAMFLCRKSNEI